MKCVSIIIPTMNEVNSIESVIRDIQSFGGLLPNYEVVVVDSSSVDGTAEIVGELSKEDPHIRIYSVGELGYGPALLEGVKRSRGDLLVVFDSTGRFSASEVLKLIQPIMKSEADLVLSSKSPRTKRRAHIGLLQRLGSLMLSLSFWLIIGIRLSDPVPDLMSLRRSVFQQLQPTSKDWTIGIEIISKAVGIGLRIEEVPVSYRYRWPPNITYRYRWRHGFTILSEMIKGSIHA
jgi:glycosyltransferase involved in cell wall biosynthesis